MNILFDTNVLIDLFLERKPFVNDAVLLVDAVERSVLNGFLCADSFTTIFYLLHKTRTKHFAEQKIKLILELFEVAPVTRGILEEACNLGFSDFEDAVKHQSAVGVNADGIVTRNSRDYSKSKLAIYTPRQLIAALDIIPR